MVTMWGLFYCYENVMCLLLTIQVQPLLETPWFNLKSWDFHRKNYLRNISQPREPHSLYLSLESLNLWGFRLENFNSWAQFIEPKPFGPQPMKPNPIGPNLDCPVENPPVIENFGNSPVVWAGYLSSAEGAGWGEFPGSDDGRFSEILGFFKEVSFVFGDMIYDYYYLDLD